MEMLNVGLLSDKNGVMNERTKSKILDILGYGSLESVKDLTSMHRARAEKENIDVLDKDILVEEYDDHLTHIDEHMRLLLTLDGDDKTDVKTKLYEHIKNHKKYDIIVNNNENLINKDN